MIVIFMLPVMLVLWMWVRLDSPGPVLFRHMRLGRDEQPFEIFKFRTMHHRDPATVDLLTEPVITNGLDTRITRAGRFLRATSLDELPQLWNILRGDMSIVGPRPVLPQQRRAIPADCLLRFAVRPGLTGLAQVRGRRGLDWMAKLASDVEYVREAGFFYDLGLIFRTLWVVVTRRGVYGEADKNWRAYLDK